MEDLHSAIQVFAEEIANGKITVILVKLEGTGPSLPWYDNLQIRDKLRSIIKVKSVDESNTQDEEELLPGY